MNKKYIATQDYWYDERSAFEIWQVVDEEGDEVFLNGTPYDLESLYLALLEHHGIEVELEFHDPV